MAKNRDMGKATSDLELAREGARRVRYAAGEVRKRMAAAGLDEPARVQDDAAQVAPGVEPAQEPTDAVPVQGYPAAEAVGAGAVGASAFVPAPAVGAAPAPASEPQAYAAHQYSVAVPYSQTAPQAQPAQQPYPTQPTQPAQQAYPAQPAQPAQSAQPAYPAQSVPAQGQPAYDYAAPTQQMPPSSYAPAADVRAAAPQAQPAYPAGAPAPQTYPYDPYGQQVPPQAAGFEAPGAAGAYQQPYMPQVQQPTYGANQGFSQGPQPETPAYQKSNKSTMAIVIAVIVGIAAIIGAVVLGRILYTYTDDYDSTFFDEFADIDGDYGYNPFADDDEYGFLDDDSDWDQYHDFDLTDPHGFDYDDLLGGQGGATHITGGGIDADDGELHDARDTSVSYAIHDSEYSDSGIEQMKFYGGTIAYDFDIDYPQLDGDIPNVDEINKQIRATAMQFVESTYNNPTEGSKELMDAYRDSEFTDAAGYADGILESDVDYAITFNNEDFISIAFSDECAFGSWLGEFINLRTINVNLKTGEVYEMDDVLMLNGDIAESFLDNLSTYDGGSSQQIAGRDEFVQAILGKGKLADSVSSTFFVDGNGKVNLGVTYRLGGADGIQRGWWDYTLTDEQLDGAKRKSDIWDLL